MEKNPNYITQYVNNIPKQSHLRIKAEVLIMAYKTQCDQAHNISRDSSLTTITLTHSTPPTLVSVLFLTMPVLLTSGPLHIADPSTCRG